MRPKLPALPSHAVRRSLTWLHRYVGLSLVLFLVVAGLSGATLSFYEELDALAFPRLPAAEVGPALDPATLAERVERAHPGLQVMYLPLAFGQAQALKLSVAPRRPGDALAYDEIFVDPRSGALLGVRSWAGPVRTVRDVMPFLFRLHYSLALGQTGSAVMGWIALAWTIDCFVGFWLTLPPTFGRGWPGRWGKAWRLRWRSTPYKLTFDLHRATGLWVWPLLFVLAWSSVAMNLSAVYDPVMRTLLPMAPPEPIRAAVDHRALSWEAALATGRRVMAAEAARRGFTVEEEVALRFIDWDGQLSYIVRSSRDAVERGDGETAVALDPVTGRVIGVSVPGSRPAGDVVSTWLLYLHEARVGGRPYDVLLAATGILIALLSVTGLVIWWKKRKARVGRGVRPHRPTAPGRPDSRPPRHPGHHGPPRDGPPAPPAPAGST